MKRTVGYAWHLRARMAEKHMFQTSDLMPPLAERGIHLSREQVYRLVTQPPQRLSMDTLAALCDILDVTPNDLIEVTAAGPAGPQARRRWWRGGADGAAHHDPPPRRAGVTRSGRPPWENATRELAAWLTSQLPGLPDDRARVLVEQACGTAARMPGPAGLRPGAACGAG